MNFKKIEDINFYTEERLFLLKLMKGYLKNYEETKDEDWLKLAERTGDMCKDYKNKINKLST